MKNTNIFLMAFGLMTTACLAAEASNNCYIISTDSLTNNTILSNNTETLNNCKIVGKVLVQPNLTDYTSTMLQAKQSGANVIYLATDPTTSNNIISSASEVGFPSSQIITLQ